MKDDEDVADFLWDEYDDDREAETCEIRPMALLKEEGFMEEDQCTYFREVASQFRCPLLTVKRWHEMYGDTPDVPHCAINWHSYDYDKLIE